MKRHSYNQPGDGSGQYPRVPRVPKLRKQMTVKLPEELMAFVERESFIRSSRPPYKEVSMSEVVKIALRLLRDTAPATVQEEKEPCDIVQQGNAAMCTTCGDRWEVDDPLGHGCPMPKTVTRRQA